jgi:CBS domain-containing protein
LPVMRAETLVGIITRSDILVAFMTINKRYERILHRYDNDATPSSSVTK